MKLFKYSWLILAVLSFSLMACQSDSDKKASIRNRHSAGGDFRADARGKALPADVNERTSRERMEQRESTTGLTGNLGCHMDKTKTVKQGDKNVITGFCTSVEVTIGPDGAVAEVKETYEDAERPYLFDVDKNDNDRSVSDDTVTWTYINNTQIAAKNSAVISLQFDETNTVFDGLNLTGSKLFKLTVEKDFSDIETKIEDLDLTEYSFFDILVVKDEDAGKLNMAAMERLLEKQVERFQRVYLKVVDDAESAQTYLDKVQKQFKKTTAVLTYVLLEQIDRLSTEQFEAIKVKVDGVEVPESKFDKARLSSPHNSVRILLLDTKLIKQADYKVEISYPADDKDIED